MFDFATLNKTSKKTVRDNINSDSWEFKPLREFAGKEILVNGFFFTEGKYGKQVVVIADGVKVNIPKRYTADFEQIRDNDEARNAMLEGHLKLTDIKNIDSANGKTTAFTFASV